MDFFGDDRRRQPRFERGDKFKCFAGGQRFTAVAANQGPGGAFLETERIFKPGSLVVLEQATTGYSDGGGKPHIVGKVLYFGFKPTRGIALEWVKAVCLSGVEPLGVFLVDYFGVELTEEMMQQLPGTARELPISFDFNTQRLLVERSLMTKRDDSMVNLFGVKVRGDALDKLDNMDVKVIASESPRQKRVIMSEDEQFKHRDDSGEDPLEIAKQMEKRLKIIRRRKECQEPVTMLADGKKHEGSAIAVDSSAIYVEGSKPFPDVRKRVLLHFPVHSDSGEVKIIIVGEIMDSLQNRARQMYGVDVKIITLNEGDKKGIFKEYLRSL